MASRLTGKTVTLSLSSVQNAGQATLAQMFLTIRPAPFMLDDRSSLIKFGHHPLILENFLSIYFGNWKN